MQPEYENENEEISVPSPDEIIPTNIKLWLRYIVVEYVALM